MMGHQHDFAGATGLLLEGKTTGGFGVELGLAAFFFAGAFFAGTAGAGFGAGGACGLGAGAGGSFGGTAGPFLGAGRALGAGFVLAIFLLCPSWFAMIDTMDLLFLNYSIVEGPIPICTNYTLTTLFVNRVVMRTLLV